MTKQQLRERCGRILANLTHDENAALNAGDRLADLLDELAGGRAEPAPSDAKTFYVGTASGPVAAPPKMRGQQVAEELIGISPVLKTDAQGPIIRLDHARGTVFFWIDDEPAGTTAGIVRRIQESVAAAIDAEREAAAKAEREACAAMFERGSSSPAADVPKPWTLAQIAYTIRERATK